MTTGFANQVDRRDRLSENMEPGNFDVILANM